MAPINNVPPFFEKSNFLSDKSGRVSHRAICLMPLSPSVKVKAGSVLDVTPESVLQYAVL